MTAREAAGQAMRDALHQANARANPFNDWFNTASQVPNPSVDWERAIAGGFAGDVSARGYELQVTRGSGGVLHFDWRHSSGRVLRGAVRGTRGRRLLLGVFAKLAEWEPELMHWRGAFAELGLFKTERSTT